MDTLAQPKASLPAEQKTRPQKIEGVAFQFCKVATVALIAGRYTLPVAAGLASVLYAWAWFSGKKDTKCVLKYPLLLTALWGVVAVISITFMLFPDVPKRLVGLFTP